MPTALNCPGNRIVLRDPPSGNAFVAGSKGEDAESLPNPNEGVLEAIKQNSRLERKAKSPIPCAHLLTGSGDSATELLLFFPHGTDPITVADQAVTLESRFGPFHLSIKFPLKDIMYKGGSHSDRAALGITSLFTP